MTAKTDALIVFSRLPIGHETKTRLAPVLSEAQREGLHLAMWQDLFREILKLPDMTQVFLYWTGSGHIQDYMHLIPGSFIVHKQCDGSLGVRMLAAIREVIESGCERVALIGSDIPGLKHEYILEAFNSLESHDVALGPSLDGGYWLIAMKRAFPEAFDVKQSQWGNSSVMDSTRKSLQNAGLSCGLVHELRDLDTPEDVRDFMTCPNSDSRTYKFLLSCIQSLAR